MRFVRTIFVILIFIASTAYGYEPKAGNICATLFETENHATIQQLKLLGQQFGVQWKSSAIYAEFYKTANDPSDINQFYSYVLNREKGKALENAQEISLQKNLKEHGVTTFETNARKTLEKISKQNLNRILPDNILKELETNLNNDRELAQVQKMLNDFEVSIIHNTRARSNNKSWNPEMPIFSSKELLQLGSTVFFGNSGKFNTDFMASSDQVFFRPRPKMKKIKDERQANEYGSQNLSLNLDYARKHGWFSAFIMTPHDLEEFYLKNLKNPKRNFKKTPNEEYFDNVELNNQQLYYAKSELYKFDFTLDDYIVLLRTQMLLSLAELKRTDSIRFETSVNTLKNGKPSEISTLTRRLVFEKLNWIPFEFKIPVAVPGTEIKIL